MILRKRDPNRYRAFRTPLVPLTPILGILICLYLIVGVPVSSRRRRAPCSRATAGCPGRRGSASWSGSSSASSFTSSTASGRAGSRRADLGVATMARTSTRTLANDPSRPSPATLQNGPILPAARAAAAFRCRSFHRRWECVSRSCSREFCWRRASRRRRQRRGRDQEVRLEPDQRRPGHRRHRRDDRRQPGRVRPRDHAQGHPIRKSSAKVRVRIDNNGHDRRGGRYRRRRLRRRGQRRRRRLERDQVGLPRQGEPHVLRHRLPVRVPAPRQGGHLHGDARDAAEGLAQKTTTTKYTSTTVESEPIVSPTPKP